jgi:transcriptional regulator with XRE-family HTH domain
VLSFGTELRRRRLDHGLSLSQLSGLVHYSKSYLSKLENGVRPASADVARRCDAVLDADGRLAALARLGGRRRRHPRSGGRGPEPAGAVWELTLSGDGYRLLPGRETSARHPVPCLALSRVRGAAAAAGDDAATGELWVAFEQLRRLGRQTPTTAVLPVLFVHTHTARELAQLAGGTPGRRLLRLAARYAELASWLIQEAGDPDAARWWLALARRLAAAAADVDLAAFTDVRRAELALHRQDPGSTIGLARSVQADGRVSARVRGIAAQLQAQAHARRGEAAECERALDRAAECAAVAAPVPPGGVLGSSCLPDPVAVATGWCWHDLHRPRAAAEILAREVAGISPAARRARTRVGARLALAAAAAGELEQSCAVAGWVVAEAERIDSATVDAELHRLAAALQRWPTARPVREIAPRLSAVLYRSGGGPGATGSAAGPA